jgi:stage II sporulation protein AA (anti-sigma F factor antagonist)
MESRFKVMHSNNTVKVTLQGRLDAVNSPSLSDELAKLKGKAIGNIVFFAKDLEYISSAGIRVIVFAKQKIGENSKIYLIGASETILDVIKMTGLANFMIVQDAYSD